MVDHASPDGRSATRQLDQLQSALGLHVSVARTDRHGIITYANDKFCELSQYARDELLGRTHAIVSSALRPPSRELSGGRHERLSDQTNQSAALA